MISMSADILSGERSEMSLMYAMCRFVQKSDAKKDMTTSQV